MGKNNTILVIDDDLDLIKMLKILLLNQSYKVITTNEIRKAKELIELYDIDLIISDVKMPQVDGFTLVKWIRSKGYQGKILMMSAFSELLDIKHAHDAGADDFLLKPMKQKNLLQKVDTLLNNKSVTGKGKNQGEEFKAVSMNVFLRHEVLEFPIFLKLTADKIVKIADAAHELDDERIYSFIEKGVKCLYLIKEDFKKHTSKYIKIAEGLENKKDVPIAKKQNYMVHIGGVIINKIYSEEINEESFYDAKEYLDSTLDILTDNSKSFSLLESLRNHGDYFTSHGMAVSIYGVMLCRKLEWDTEKTLGLVAMGGIFHDIGKKDLDRSVIEKNPSELTPEEKIALDSHPIHGIEVLNNLHVFEDSLIQIILQHHECNDGSGFPFHLKRDRILKLAKLIYIVDLFCNYILPPPYGTPVPPKVAIAIIEKDHKNEVDQEFIDAFKALLKNKH